MKNCEKEIVGVFKPKNEEPYAHLNPKWTKWLHRTWFPCFFGRSCLRTNFGYLSEAGASLVDRFYGFNVVPRTEIVQIGSTSFFYSPWDRFCASKDKTMKYPPKIGSFQMFVKGFEESSVVMEKIFNLEEKEMIEKFQIEFEKMVMLDYIIRNTDRSMSNWMIHLSEGNVRIACIDNGLAFPYKHPDKWRTYPYSWINYPQSLKPFSTQNISTFLPKLTLERFENLENLLFDLFQVDGKRFDPYVFRSQISILKGQIYNLSLALEKKLSPFELLNLPLAVVQSEDDFYFRRNPHTIEHKATTVNGIKYFISFIEVKPTFTCF